MKFAKPSPEQVTAFARRAIAALPDGLSDQRADLQVLVRILPAGNEGRRVAKEMLLAIMLRDQAQAEFAFTQSTPSTHNGAKP